MDSRFPLLLVLAMLLTAKLTFSIPTPKPLGVINLPNLPEIPDHQQLVNYLLETLPIESRSPAISTPPPLSLPPAVNAPPYLHSPLQLETQHGTPVTDRTSTTTRFSIARNRGPMRRLDLDPYESIPPPLAVERQRFEAERQGLIAPPNTPERADD